MRVAQLLSICCIQEKQHAEGVVPGQRGPICLAVFQIVVVHVRSAFSFVPVLFVFACSAHTSHQPKDSMDIPIMCNSHIIHWLHGLVDVRRLQMVVILVVRLSGCARRVFVVMADELLALWCNTIESSVAAEVLSTMIIVSYI